MAWSYIGTRQLLKDVVIPVCISPKSSQDINPNSRDLLRRIRQGVEGFKDVFSQNLVLDRHYSRQKDVVKRFGFDSDVKLLDPETQTSHQLFHGAKGERETWLNKAAEFPPSFDDAHFGRTDGEAARDAHCDG